MKIRLLLLGLILLSFYSYGQEEQEENTIAIQFQKLVNVPNSPEAEAFTKYGDYDANLFTGTPNISVPLYTIKGREMNLPISLSYDASGIKVNQKASNVGLGWNLNVGGRISRQVRGMPDHQFVTQGDPSLTPADLTTRTTINDYVDFDGIDGTDFFDGVNIDEISNNVQAYYQFLTKVSKGAIDVEQDYFSLNIMGLNETLWMDTETYTPVPLNDPNLKILSPTSFDNEPDYWEILDTDGNRYIFGIDILGDYPPNFDFTSNPIEKVKRINSDDSNSNYNLKTIYKSSWLISKIVSKNGKDVYHFEYTNKSEFLNPESPEIVNQSISHKLMAKGVGVVEYTGAGSYPLNNKISNVKSQYTQQYLKAIYHNDKKVVEFDFEDRYDIQHTDNMAISGFSVSEDLFNSNLPIIETIDFDYTYFGDLNPQNFYDKRLKLDRINMKQNDVENYYTFNYYSPTSVPNRKSNAFDVMGYFNDSDCSTPFRKWYRETELELPGATRDSNPLTSKVGTLEQITYPTGGVTTFNFENHSDGTNIYPGLRIKSIMNYSSTGVLETHKEYDYPDDSFTENYTPILDKVITSQPSPCPSQYPYATGSTLQRYLSPPNTDLIPTRS